MIFYNKNKEKGIDWFQMLCFIVVMLIIAKAIFNIGIYLGFLVNK